MIIRLFWGANIYITNSTFELQFNADADFQNCFWRENSRAIGIYVQFLRSTLNVKKKSCVCVRFEILEILNKYYNNESDKFFFTTSTLKLYYNCFRTNVNKSSNILPYIKLIIKQINLNRHVYVLRPAYGLT